MSCERLPPLLGHVVALTGDRRSEELTAHLESLGSTVVHGPVVRTRPVNHNDDRLRQHTLALIARPPDVLLVTTGIGVRSWVNAAASSGLRAELLAALAPATVLARGPKAAGAVVEAGLSVAYTEPSGRTEALVQRVLERPVRGLHVAVQLPGAPMVEAIARLRRAGAEVTALTVYDWLEPDDLGPARRLIRSVADGRVSAVTFTSRPAVRNLFSLAEAEGLTAALAAAFRSSVTPVCIGEVTAAALLELTGVEPVVPDKPLLGLLAQVVGETLRSCGHHHVRTAAGTDVIVQGRHIRGASTSVTMSDREAAVLNRLLDRQRTLSRDELLRCVWRSERVDPSVVDTTIARLRRRSSRTGLTILTVTGRGYLLGGDLRPCPALSPV